MTLRLQVYRSAYLLLRPGSILHPKIAYPFSDVSLVER